jgi:DNA repair exonuclease SbcCD ATPase subunit
VVYVAFYSAGTAFEHRISNNIKSNNASNQANAAIDQVNAAFDKLNGQLDQFQNRLNSCEQLTCVTTADGKLAGQITAFAAKLQTAQMPVAAQPAANQVHANATKTARALSKMSQATNESQYQRTAKRTRFVHDYNQLVADYNRLADALDAAVPQSI